MKKVFVILTVALVVMTACHPALTIQEYVSSTMDMPWQVGSPLPASGDSVVVIEICPDSTGQAIRGFGVSFSELSAYSLSLLTESDRKAVLDELFVPGQAAWIGTPTTRWTRISGWKDSPSPMMNNG